MAYLHGENTTIASIKIVKNHTSSVSISIKLKQSLIGAEIKLRRAEMNKN